MGSNGLSAFLSARWTRRVATGVVVRRRDGRFLVLRRDVGTGLQDSGGAAEPDFWRLPGGPVKTGESPRAAARRDLRLDLGLDVVPGRAVVTDFVQGSGDADGDSLTVVFDGGTWVTSLDGYRAAGGTVEARFVTPAEAATLLEPRELDRLRAALDGLELLSVVELENGQRVQFEETPGPMSGMILMPELPQPAAKAGSTP